MWALVVVAAVAQTLGVLRVHEDTGHFRVATSAASAYEDTFTPDATGYRSRYRTIDRTLVVELERAVASSQRDGFDPEAFGLAPDRFAVQRETFIAAAQPRLRGVTALRDGARERKPPWPAYSREELDAVLTPDFVAKELFLDCWNCLENLSVSVDGRDGFVVESVLPESAKWRVTQRGRSWTTSSSRLLMAMVALLPSDNAFRQKLEPSRWRNGLADEHGIENVVRAMNARRAEARWRTIRGHDALFATLRLKDASFELSETDVLFGSFEPFGDGHFCEVGWDVPMNSEPDVPDMLRRRERIEQQLRTVAWLHKRHWKVGAIFGRISDLDRQKWNEAHLRGEPDAQVYVGEDRFMGAEVWLLVGADDARALETDRLKNGGRTQGDPIVIETVKGKLRLEAP